MVNHLQQPLATLLQVRLDLRAARTQLLELLQLSLDLVGDAGRVGAGLLIEVG